jgi:thioredoxin reductase
VIKIEKADQFFVLNTKAKAQFRAKTVIIATGADPRPLEVPGEKEFIGKGVSYCVTCDGALFKSKQVVVIGGGNAGFEAAIILANFAKKIYILEYGSKCKADKANQEKIKMIGKVEVITSVEIKKFEGEKFLNSVIYRDRRTNKNYILPADGVFIQIGIQPATSFVKDLVDFNEKDEIMVEFETYQTKVPGLFAVGDVNIGKFKQIITACGEGAKAALAAYEYLEK